MCEEKGRRDTRDAPLYSEPARQFPFTLIPTEARANVPTGYGNGLLTSVALHVAGTLQFFTPGEH